MKILTSILIYFLTLALTPIVLVFYSEFSKALLTLLLTVTVIGIPVSWVIGVMAVRSHRKPIHA